MTDLLKDYGITGICLAILAAYFAFIEKKRGKEREELEKAHREERKEWRATIEKQFEEQARNTKENTSVLASLKQMLENRK